MNEAIHSATPSVVPPKNQTDCLSRIVLLLVWLWIAFITALRIGIELLMSGFIGALPNWKFFLPSLSQAILLAVPLVPFAVFWGNQRYRRIYQAWALAAGVQLTIAPVHLLRPDAAQLAALYQIAAYLVWSMVILAVGFWRRNPDRPSWRAVDGNITGALLVAGLFMLPWAAWGALGSPWDILFQLGGGLAFGLLAAVLMERFLFRLDPPGSANQSRGGWSSFLFQGFVVGTLLALLASGTTFPFAGLQLLLTICLPPLGWLLAVLAGAGRQDAGRSRSRLPGLALLVGLCAAAPMLFIDADELPLAISLSAGETLSWGLKASTAALLVELVAGLAARLLQTTRAVQPQRGAALSWGRGGLAIGALISWLGVVLVFFSLGQPGWHGDGLFMILKQQADVSAAAQIEDYTQRRTFVYNTLVATADQSQADLRQTLDRLHIRYHPYYLINAMAVEGGPVLRFWLSRQPEVDRVLNDPWLRPLPEQPPVHTGNLPMPTQPEWNLTLIGADQAWKDLGITGQGIVIGQSDSGVQWDHPELMATYRGSGGESGVVDHNYNWYDPWYGTRAPVDRGGHGTHTTGIIVGQHVGVAPGATWYACANLARNLGNPSLYLDCMQFMLAPFPLDGNPFTDGDPGRGAHVLNNSWGCPEIEGCDAETFLTAIQALRAAGLFVVASAGNDGPGCATLNSPLALYADAFSVGSINSAKQLSIFSSLGPVTADGSKRIKPDIVAPGEKVLSSMPEGTYAALDGTSMAGPHVVGVVALVWSANPQLIGNIEATEQILIHAAQPYQGSLPNCPGASQIPSTAYGYGIIDAYQAVRQALDLKGSLP